LTKKEGRESVSGGTAEEQQNTTYKENRQSRGKKSDRKEIIARKNAKSVIVRDASKKPMPGSNTLKAEKAAVGSGGNRK